MKGMIAMTILRVGRMVILVREIEEALRFYCDVLGFEKKVTYKNTAHIFLPAQDNAGIWLIQASNEEDQARVGKQTGHEPCMVFYTDHCWDTYNTLREKGVKFRGKPEEHEDSIYVHFFDLYGNEIVLVELKSEEPGT
jgi:catechol 2,3-dioxygenase-like lactoylglutathione lyase family enzyme